MAEFSRPDWARRCQAATRAARVAPVDLTTQTVPTATTVTTRSVDALVVTTPANIRYLTGFKGSTAWVVLTPADIRILTDGRYLADVRGGMAAGRLVPMTLDLVQLGYDQALATLVHAAGFRRIAFEAGHVTIAGLRRWQDVLPSVEWEPTEGLIEELRIIKDATEIDTLRRAGHLLAGVVGRLPELVRKGLTEREVARAIDAAIDDAGFERPAFETIVGSGPNSSYPHARPTDRRLQEGDLVVLDFGGVLDGYCVDLTRMAAVGQIDSEARLLVEAVSEAQRAALEAVRAGATSADVDRAARGRLESRGLGPAFSHGTGHGLGLDVHEAPRISRAESGHVTTLAPGMVFTIEPGAYIEGIQGVRLEDDVLVTAEGAEVITPAPRDLLVV